MTSSALFSQLSRLSPERLQELATEIRASQIKRSRRDKLAKLFPQSDTLNADDGVLYHARASYPKHMEFFRLGAAHGERALMAANRVGKTVCGAYEVACHMTGIYPDWWEGRRFGGPVDVWAGSDTGETTRDIVQLALMGPVADYGTGAIPHRCINGFSMRKGVTDAIDVVRVRHASGGVSTVGFKSYDQGREKWQGTARHVIWLDEEPPEDVYDEEIGRAH